MSGFISTTPAERDAMLSRIGVSTIDQLFEDLPAEHYRPDLDLPPGLSELETWQLLRKLSETNLDLERHPSFLGAGAYRHFVPAAIGHLISRGEFLTSYTPYQPEVSQGTLQAVYEWQSIVCALTGMDISNASVYDAGTGTGEAARMACALTRRRRVLVLDTVNPRYREVLATYASGPDIDVETVAAFTARHDGTLGRVTDFSSKIDSSVAVGLREVAEQSIQKAHYLASRISQLPGYTVQSTAPWLYEFPIHCPKPAARVNEALLAAGIIGGYDLGLEDPALAHSAVHDGASLRPSSGHSIFAGRQEGIPVVFDKSVKGRRAGKLPALDVPEIDLDEIIPQGERRHALPLPELSELDVVRPWHPKPACRNHGPPGCFNATCRWRPW
ncbi:MAG: hypothetical protein EBT22_02530 [Chloroflexi bacterium]|nr:hypothetical protein [Chloroflexota bacterium]